MLLVADFGQYKMMQKQDLAHGYSSESTQWELFKEYQHDKVYMVFKIQKSLRPWALDEISLGIERVKYCLDQRYLCK